MRLKDAIEHRKRRRLELIPDGRLRKEGVERAFRIMGYIRKWLGCGVLVQSSFSS